MGHRKEVLILPQVQTIREALDGDAIVVVAKDNELKSVLHSLKSLPDLVVTDSQAIMRVASEVPDNVKLTTFSILMARQRGDLPYFVKGLIRVKELRDGDKILIAEACTHHAQKNDIGRIKIPRWLKLYTNKDLKFEVKSGSDFPDNLEDYKLIIHCGGCMITKQTMQSRINQAKLIDVPITNYGVLVSYLHGAIPRALIPFSEAISEWKKLS